VLLVVLDTTVFLDITSWLDVRPDPDPLLNSKLLFMVLLVPFSASEIRLCILDFKLLLKLLKLLVIESVEFSSMAYTFTYELKTDNVANMKMVTYHIGSMLLLQMLLSFIIFLANISNIQNYFYYL